jgi:hypothetical protein
MLLLKPRRPLRLLTPGMQHVLEVYSEGRIRQHTFELIPRDGLQNNPWVLREFPQDGIKRAPYLVGGMIPRPAKIQGQLSEGIETLDFRG